MYRLDQLYRWGFDENGELVSELLKGVDPKVRCLGK